MKTTRGDGVRAFAKLRRADGRPRTDRAIEIRGPREPRGQVTVGRIHGDSGERHGFAEENLRTVCRRQDRHGRRGRRDIQRNLRRPRHTVRVDDAGTDEMAALRQHHG